jgi:hypothetical protein
MVNRAHPPDVPRGQLVAKPHDAYDGTPFFDEDLQVPQSPAHRIMVYETGSIVDVVAQEAGLRFASDEPIWYLDPDQDVQRAYYGDWVIARDVPMERVTAHDLVVVLEVVSTNDRRKEIKDTVFQRALNEYNGVPEFGLVFPDADDPRALQWFTLVEGRYHELTVSAGGQVEVAGVPGLVFRVRPQERWTDGRKLDVLYRGELRHPLPEAYAQAEAEKARAEEEKARAEEEKARAEEEKARAEEAKARVEEEKARAEEAKARAEEEKARADRLAEHMRAMGLDPDALE